MSVAANVGPGGALVYTHSASSYLLTLQAPMGLSAASWSSARIKVSLEVSSNAARLGDKATKDALLQMIIFTHSASSYLLTPQAPKGLSAKKFFRIWFIYALEGIVLALQFFLQSVTFETL